MIPACSLDTIKYKLSSKYEDGEECIIGIMFARYDITLSQGMINECYQYWHELAGIGFDMFWIGYGEYGCEDNNYKTIEMTFPGNNTYNYFSTREFIDSVREIKSLTRDKWKYNDKIQLMLVNCKDGKIDLSKIIAIDLEKNLGENNSNLRQLVYNIIEYSRSYSDVREVKPLLRRDGFWQSLKSVKFIQVVEFLSLLK